MGFLPAWPIELNTLAVFGILLTAGALGGFLAHRWPWLPSITGFMFVGLVIGPSGLNLLTTEVLSDAHVLVDIALGLILYLTCAWQALRLDWCRRANYCSRPRRLR